MRKNQKPLLNDLLLAELNQDDSEDLIQLVSKGDEHEPEKDAPDEVPLLPLKNTVLFPGVVVPITVGRKKSIKLVKKAYAGDRLIGVVAQKEPVEDPEVEDLYKIGTLARILKMLVLPDGNTTIIIQGKQRFKIREYLTTEPYISARVKYLRDKNPLDNKIKEHRFMAKRLKDVARQLLKLNPELPQEAQVALDNISNPTFLTHFLSANINVDVVDKQRLLEVNDGYQRAEMLLAFMYQEIDILELQQEIHKKTATDLDKQQRDYYLRTQMKILQDELGYGGPDKDIEEMRERAAKKDWSEAVARHFNKELDKLQRINPMAAEYPVAANYLELMLELPWNETTQDDLDLRRARRILDRDHYGLEKVKDRIIEYLAVLKLKKDMKGPILCLYGPPGVGKTSLGKSIAKALRRKYVRLSLGGVHDEAQIRGHRKTYVGAMPGMIIQNIKKAGSSNPVFVLDEVDKVGNNFRGDPSSALLEVLDPEQNNAFHDNYLEVDYDLSRVLFIATANSLDTIHPALRDRMEIVEINGYTLEEKVEIAKRHLIPKLLREHGLTKEAVRFRKPAIVKVIEGYTRESGVRGLERKLGTIIRKIARAVAMEEEYDKTITPQRVVELLGPELYDKELYQGNKQAGVVTGLAWTPVGGDILFIESSVSRGKGKLTISGQLGDVMKESAMAALSYLRANADRLDIDYRVFDNYDLHIHVPAGAVPKDGPSAGITILTSLASLFTQRKVKAGIAMTGEITLRGKVLPVGGIREKVLAARRAGIKEVILCRKNERDINEIDEQYLKGLTFKYVDTVDEVLEEALLDEKVANPIEFVIPEKK